MHSAHFLIFRLKCVLNVTIGEDCMIFEYYRSLNAIYLKCAKSMLAVVPLLTQSNILQYIFS